MAKRRLGIPLAPPGPQFNFFAVMQEFVLKRGDPSLAAMSKVTGYSRQALHKALRGPDLPSRDLVKSIANALFSKGDDEDADTNADDRREAVRQALDAWGDAVADKTTRDRGIASAATPVTQHSDTPVGGRRDGPGPATQALSDTLRQIYEQAGSPSYRMITHRMRSEGFSAASSSISDWLSGKSVPNDIDSVMTLVAALQGRDIRAAHRADGPAMKVVRELWIAARNERQSGRRPRS